MTVMVPLGVLLALLGLGALMYRRSEPVILAGTKTMRVKPVVVVLILGLAALCFVAAASDSGRSSGDEEPPAQTKPARHRDRR
jgi:hypothetical protein